MKIQTIQKRTGFSLLEVLISLLIMLIGVTSVIALFPVAISRVRQAVLDTRCTFIGVSMWEVVDLKNFQYDPLHLDPSPSTDPDANFLALPFNPGPTSPANDSYYLHVVDPDQSNPNGNPLIGPGPWDTMLHTDCQTGVPVLIDPLWIEEWRERASPTSTSLNGAGWDDFRQTFAEFPDVAPFDATSWGGIRPRPLRVVTTWEVASIVDPTARRAYVNRWFMSDGDIQYREALPGIPFAPADQPIYHQDIFTQGLPLPDASCSARRHYAYSWAFIVQHSMTPVTGTNGQDPPQLGEVVNAYVLVFYKRNLADPFDVAMGAFFEDDARVTLRYDTTKAKPEIRRGTWLLECTIAGTARRDPAGARVHERRPRGFAFHRVADVEDALVDDGGTIVPVLAVTLETTPGSGYNPALDRPDDRQFPDPPHGTKVIPPSGGEYTVDYSPVYILHGLQEWGLRPAQ